MARKKELTFYEMLEDDFERFYIKYDEETSNKNVDVISTGSLSLDVSTGIGGIPKGRFTELYGSKGSAKTSLLLNVAKHAILNGDAVLIVDGEQAITFPLAESIIGDSVYDPTKFVLMQPELMEDSLRICEKGILSGEFGLIGLDSIGSLAPKKVKEDDLIDDNVALLARRMTVFLQRNAFDVKDSNVAFIGINQVRDKIGGYSKEFATPGGHAWEHITSLRIMLSRISVIKQGEEKIGINTKFVIKDNKLAPPFRSFEFPVMFGEGIDELRDVINFAKTIGVIQLSGSYYKFEGESLGRGIIEAMGTLENDEKTLDKVKEKCYNLVKKETNNGSCIKGV